ncbi:MAG: imidazole glycerol phosphate synthase subunit HisH [Desulfobulbaceae bacterium]|nr:imidazole glycerol phosphate synthase subunit HisH [Desulfobulbaceae bacterium]
MKKVAIIDYDMGNVDSVYRAVEECGGVPRITRDAAEIKNADCVILPGVGAYKDGMSNLREYHLDEIVGERVLVKKIPFLGICLGMQLIADKGYEFGETEGLGWISGEIIKLDPGDSLSRIPHVGWNEVHYNQSPLFDDIPQGKDFYFVHSFHFQPARQHFVLATTPYCGEFVSAVNRENIFGVQFHPEKSQRIGFKVLKNFLAL